MKIFYNKAIIKIIFDSKKFVQKPLTIALNNISLITQFKTIQNMN